MKVDDDGDDGNDDGSWWWWVTVTVMNQKISKLAGVFRGMGEGGRKGGDEAQHEGENGGCRTGTWKGGVSRAGYEVSHVTAGACRKL